MDGRAKYVVPAVLLIAAGTGGAWQLGYFDKSHGAISICRAAIKGQLKSPSSYKEIKVESTDVDPPSFEEFKRKQSNRGCYTEARGYEDGCKFAKDMLSISTQFSVDPSHPEKFKSIDEMLKSRYSMMQKEPVENQRSTVVIIDYDAENSFGAPLRAKGVCGFDVIGSDHSYKEDDLTSAGSVS